MSPGLVIHHYGSKAELRDVCDAHIIAELIEKPSRAAEQPSVSLVQSMLGRVETAGPMFDYLARRLVEQGETGDKIFARLVSSTRETLADGRGRGTIQPASDPDVTALLVTVSVLSQFLLRARFAQLLEADPFSPEGVRRLTLPTLELYTNGLYADTSLLDTVRGALATDSQGAAEHEEETA